MASRRAELAAQLVELRADVLDLRLGDAQLLDIGAHGDAAQRRGHAHLELIEATADA